MPLYEYECDACGKRFEVIQKFSDPAPDACRKCGSGPVHRLQSSPAIQFKGSGFYITDYAQKSGSDSGKASGSSASSSEAAKETKDTKPASESAAKTETTTKADAPATSSPPTSATKE